MEDIREWIESNTFSGGYGEGSGSGWGYSSGEGSGFVTCFGSGEGSGSGWGSSYCDGNGCGFGLGSGDGGGQGNSWGSFFCYESNTVGGRIGWGSGGSDGSGLGSFNGKPVYQIDDIPTIITSVKLALARGFILKPDLSLVPCYIVKEEGCFAHGKTLNEAKEALHDKIMRRMGTDETIEKFLESFKKGEKYPGADFFKWHHYLTGSCLMGRESFVRDNGLSLDSEYTVEEFISLCENAYGGEIIKKLKERYENE